MLHHGNHTGRTYGLPAFNRTAADNARARTGALVNVPFPRHLANLATANYTCRQCRSPQWDGDGDGYGYAASLSISRRQKSTLSRVYQTKLNTL
jgi:hypothetical protein